MNPTGTLIGEIEILDRTRDWVKENFLYMRPDKKLLDSESLLGSGVIDSVGVIELVEFLQRSFGIEVADEEITESNLGSLKAVGRFVYAKCRTGAGTERRSHQRA
jgi:acyl carrier protein